MRLILDDIHVATFDTGHQGPEEPKEPGPISQTCVSDITWIAGPVCCALP